MLNTIDHTLRILCVATLAVGTFNHAVMADEMECRDAVKTGVIWPCNGESHTLAPSAFCQAVSRRSDDVKVREISDHVRSSTALAKMTADFSDSKSITYYVERAKITGLSKSKLGNWRDALFIAKVDNHACGRLMAVIDLRESQLNGPPGDYGIIVDGIGFDPHCTFKDAVQLSLLENGDDIYLRVLSKPIADRPRMALVETYRLDMDLQKEIVLDDLDSLSPIVPTLTARISCAMPK